MKPEAKRPPGRPTLRESERKRHCMTFRVRDVRKDLLAASAKENQRSLSEEIEARLERSFRDDEVLAVLRDLQERMPKSA